MEENFMVTERLLERDAQTRSEASDWPKKMLNKLSTLLFDQKRFPASEVPPSVTIEGVREGRYANGYFFTTSDLLVHFNDGEKEKIKVTLESEAPVSVLIWFAGNDKKIRRLRDPKLMRILQQVIECTPSHRAEIERKRRAQLESLDSKKKQDSA